MLTEHSKLALDKLAPMSLRLTLKTIRIFFAKVRTDKSRVIIKGDVEKLEKEKSSVLIKNTICEHIKERQNIFIYELHVIIQGDKN